jgi:hypothetical protein
VLGGRKNAAGRAEQAIRWTDGAEEPDDTLAHMRVVWIDDFD